MSAPSSPGHDEPSDPRADIGRISNEIDAALARGETPRAASWARDWPGGIPELEELIELRTCLHQEGLHGGEPSDEALLAEVEAAIQDALNRGETPDLVTWQARHPHLASEIERLSEVPGFVREVLEGERGIGRPQLAADRVETFLGRFRTLGRIGDHPAGTLFRGVCDDDPAPVELLVLGPSIPRECAWRVLREADSRGLALEAGNLLPVLAVGETRGVLFVAFEHRDGVSLRQAIMDLAFHGGGRRLRNVVPPRGRPVCDESREEDRREARAQRPRAAERLVRDAEHVQQAVELARTLARALARLHLQGGFHRGLSPSSVIVDGEGTAWLRWLGLTRHLPPATLRAHASVGWLAPETWEPGRAADWRCDVFGVAAILHGLLFLRPPFSRAGLGQGLALARRRLEQRLSVLPPKLAETLSQALHPSPRARPRSCETLATLLGES